MVCAGGDRGGGDGIRGVEYLGPGAAAGVCDYLFGDGVDYCAVRCALGLATPMSIMVASGKGASAGVLFKNAEAIERLRDVDTLVVDKTGTLTEGRPKLVAVTGSAGMEENVLLGLVAGLERGSEHPLAEAIVEGRKDAG